jgi:hypothetical protein
MIFKYWHCFLPEYGTRVPKYVGEAHLKSLLITDANLIDKYMVYADIQFCYICCIESELFQLSSGAIEQPVK